MWKYFTKEHNKEFILSLDLIKNKNISDDKKLNILYTIANNNKKYYTTKYILKKDGGKRKLLIPNNYLKSIQKNILNNVLNGLRVSNYVKSYLKGVSLVDNAKEHINKKIILKLDIKDFFNSIDFEALYKVLPNEVLPPSVKVLILKLCTYDDYLPQGAPTSPMLSNLVLKHFDNYIGKYCSDLNINYTRYADDLTFSGDFNYKLLINKVRAYLENMGFNLNMKKTKVIKNYEKQIVTGIVVNKKINISKNYKDKIRQEMYYINKYGIDSHVKYLNVDKREYINSLKGRINYVYNTLKDEKYKNYLNILNMIKY